MHGFTTNQKREGSRLTVGFNGFVDEHAEFPSDIVADELVMELGGITGINSAGIKMWINWQKSINPKMKRLIRNCPYPVINQVALVANFFPDGTMVESFEVPYFCGTCMDQPVHLFTSGKEIVHSGHQVTELRLPQLKCKKCSVALEINAIESRYFHWLGNIKISSMA